MTLHTSSKPVICHANVFAEPELYEPVRACVKDLNGELLFGTFSQREKLLEFARPASIFLTSAIKWDAKLFSELPRLEMVVTYGSGYDFISIEDATTAGVVVAYSPRYGYEEVSDHAIGLLLVCARRLAQLDHQVRNGLWGGKISFDPPLRRVSSSTLGILGLGHIGTEVCRKARALGMRVLVWDPWVSEEQTLERGGEYISNLDVLLSDSDYVSLHLRLSHLTHHLIGESQFLKFKPTAFLINTARGGLVHETALVKAIEEGRLAGAALDTIDPEPPLLDNPLFKLPQVIVTGHYGSVSVEANRERHFHVANTIKRFSEGTWPEFVANPTVVPKSQLVSK